MKTFSKLLSIIISACLILSLCGCSHNAQSDPVSSQAEAYDYAAFVKLDMSSETVKQEVTVKTFVDGDTTHFVVPSDVSDTGVLKARYIAINTPESTGKIEEYGKKASEFTKEKLSSAVSIIVESDTNRWNIDSTGSRYLVWVWYKTADNEDYRNLNIEILQNGLAIASNSSQNRYGETAVAAIDQAKRDKLNIYSGEKDPDFYYGDAVELTLKELRCNLSQYNGMKVAFNGIITKNSGNSVYVEDYDSDTDMYYGITVYYGYGLSGTGLDILSVGNESRIVGTLQFYEAGGTYQISGLTYRQMKPDDPGNIQKLSDGHKAAYRPVSAEQFAYGVVRIERAPGSEPEDFSFKELAMNTTVSMTDLQVKSIYTTVNEDSSSYGAMTLTCESDGVTIVVRTAVLLDESGNLITSDAYAGKTIDVLGIVDYYDGDYQIKVFSAEDITIK